METPFLVRETTNAFVRFGNALFLRFSPYCIAHAHNIVPERSGNLNELLLPCTRHSRYYDNIHPMITEVL